MMKHTLLGLAGAGAFLLAVASCTDELVTSNVAVASSQEIEVTVQEFDGLDTRTTATVGETGVNYAWEGGDLMTVFEEDGSKCQFVYSNGKFVSGGGLKASPSYAAIYPSTYADCTIKEVPVYYYAINQKGNTPNIGNVDWMAAAPTAAVDGKLSLNFRHLGSFIQLQVTAPADGEVTEVKLSHKDNLFVTKGTVDLTAETPAITPTAKASSMSIYLSDVNAVAGQPLTLYTMVAPVDLTGKELKLTITYASGESYKGTMTITKEFKAGKAYKLSAEAPTVKGQWQKGYWEAYYGNIEMSHKSIITAFEDGTYTISNWYNNDGYDLDFTPTADGADFTITNNYNESGVYRYMSVGDERLSLTNGDGYSEFSGKADEGYIGFYMYLGDAATYDWVNFSWPYEPPSIDNLVGEYTEAASGYEGLTVSGANTEFSYTDNPVTVALNEDGKTITIKNLFYPVQNVYAPGYPIELKGTPDMENGIIMIDMFQTAMSYYTVAPYFNEYGIIIATFDEDFNITIPSWALWYGGYTYITGYNYDTEAYEGITSVLTKKAAATEGEAGEEAAAR